MGRLAVGCVLAALVALAGYGDDEEQAEKSTTVSRKRQSTTTPGTAPTPVMPTLTESPGQP